MVKKDINLELRVLRSVHKIPLRVLAERTGLSISYLSDLEHGRTAPSLKTVEKIADAYNMDIDIVFVYRGVTSRE